MEESKYYVPELSEFHVGFECEMFSLRNDWYTRELDARDVQVAIDICFETNDFDKTYRTKYLDKSDIEECGFVQDGNESGEESPSLFDEHGYSLVYVLDKQLEPINTAWTIYHFPDNFLIIERIVNCGIGFEDMLFRGRVKNKSELKMLLKMLNIK